MLGTIAAIAFWLVLGFGALLTIVIAVFWVTVIVAVLVNWLIECFGRKAAVLDKNEFQTIINEVRKQNPDVADSLSAKIFAEEKLAMIERDNGFEFRTIRAKDSSNDKMEHGGVVFASGEYILYDKRGKEKERGKIDV